MTLREDTTPIYWTSPLKEVAGESGAFYAMARLHINLDVADADAAAFVRDGFASLVTPFYQNTANAHFALLREPIEGEKKK